MLQESHRNLLFDIKSTIELPQIAYLVPEILFFTSFTFILYFAKS